MNVDVMRRQIELADGRVLDAWIDPDASGVPFVFHFGTPSSGLPLATHLAAARERGLRWISWSRPGYGSSSRLEGRSVTDVVRDTREVLDQLGAERCYVAGWSGGGPHALACAALMPDRVLGVTTIAGVGPYVVPDGLEAFDFLAGMGAENVEGFNATLEGPEAEAAMLEREWPVMRAVTAEQIADAFGDLIDDVDRASLSGDFAEFAAANMHEGLRDSYLGWMDDDLAFVRPWGFELDAFEVPVHIWQGAHDRMVPFAHGEWLAGACRGACPHLLPEHGHLSSGRGLLRRHPRRDAGPLAHPGSLFGAGNDGQDLGAVGVELDRAHALDAAQGGERVGPLGGDGRQHRVVGHDIGRHGVLLGALAAPELQGLQGAASPTQTLAAEPRG